MPTSNEELIDLLKIIRQAGLADSSRPTKIPDEDRAAFKNNLESLLTYLFIVATRETDDIRTASTVADKLTRAFYEKAFTIADDKVFLERVEWALWGGVGPRYWLFKEARLVARGAWRPWSKLIARFWGPGSIPWRDYRRYISNPLRQKLIHGRCQLLAGREAHERRKNNACHRECDMLFFRDFEFSGKELSNGLNISESSVSRYIIECEGRAITFRTSEKSR